MALAEPLPGFPPPRFVAVVLQWFAQVDDAWRNEAWLRSVAPDLVPGDGCLVVAEEVVLRGRDYLDARWAAGGERYKMISAARRNPRLAPVEFSARWRAEAGRLGAEGIPEDVRGLAYVQNHPLLVDGREWPVDAVNEVYFERLGDLRRRHEWFAARQDAALRAGPDGIFSPSKNWSLLVREEPLAAP